MHNSKLDICRLLNKADKLKKKKRYNDAIVYYENAFDIIEDINTNFNKLYTIYFLAFCYQKIDDFSTSLQYVEQYIQLNSNKFNMHGNKLVLLNRMNLYNQSVEYCNEILPKFINEYRLYDQHGYALLMLEKYKESLILINKSISLNNTDLYATSIKLILCNRLSKFQESLKCVELLLDSNYNINKYNYHIGYTFLNIGDYKKALIYFKNEYNSKNTYKSNKNISTLYGLVQCHYNLKHFKSAKKYYEKLIKIDPDNTEYDLIHNDITESHNKLSFIKRLLNK